MLHQPLRRPGVVTLATAAFSQTADLLQTDSASPRPSSRRK